jgi:hypothetical protein
MRTIFFIFFPDRVGGFARRAPILILSAVPNPFMLMGMKELIARLMPRVQPMRSWIQFSLRTILVLVTVLCVSLGAWIVPAERQRRVTATIDGLGGRVEYAAFDGSSREAFLQRLLRRWVPRHYFDEVRAADFSSCELSDSGLVSIKWLRGLQRLNLGDTHITDAGLAHVGGLTSLRHLNLVGTRVSDDGLSHLQDLNQLQELVLIGTQVSDAGLSHLHDLTNLREIHLDNTEITDAGLRHLHHLTSLRELHLSGTSVTDAGLAHLRGFTGLMWLSLANTRVTNVGLAEIRQERPNCWLTTSNRW